MSGKKFTLGMALLISGFSLLLSFVFIPLHLSDFLCVFGGLGLMLLILGLAVMCTGVFSKEKRAGEEKEEETAEFLS